MFRDREQILEALSRTGRRLALADADEHSLLVCGGSALNLSGLLDRPTRDVDVLGLVKGPKATLVVEELLPEEVRRAAETVALDLNLPSDWLNDAALEVHRMGLPVGILKRAESSRGRVSLSSSSLCVRLARKTGVFRSIPTLSNFKCRIPTAK